MHGYAWGGSTPAGRVASFDGLADRFVEHLGVPGADPEIRTLAGMLESALETAWQTGLVAVLDDTMRFVEGRLDVHGLGHVTCTGIRDAVATAAAPLLEVGERARLHGLLARCLAEPSRTTDPTADTVGPLSAAYVDLLMRGDRRGALALTRRCLTDGMSILEIVLDVLEPAQREVGRRWALGNISVTHEHFCTAVTQFVMTDLYPGLSSSKEGQRRLVAVHAPGSLHHVGLRMVIDVLECHDWNTAYLGDDITGESLPDLVPEAHTDLLLISATVPGDVSSVAALIRAVRQDARTRGVKVVVGGRPFLVAPGLADALGADGWARDARSAIDVCDALVGRRS